ncbi:ATP-dependent DNA helicase RecG [Arthrobacter sp. UM1]|uniref:ATP-dependent DNA helicase RecG n=1 Tax=Arthrobacter sp. UM1 TaxID=2766776 RepID=UPI001CF67B51|nr:ATP-dependent DNA helicase RecG [Arthrobacter sp. UM1]MCB4207306.1 ATP-dependent DNA helicase RecG [Arthrobacter sp. UM1]
MSIGLTTELAEVLGKRAAGPLASELGLETVEDLLDRIPRSYVALGERSSLEDLPIDTDVSVVAEVAALSTRRLHTRKGTMTEVTVTDGEHELTFSLFGHYKAHSGLEVGALGLLSGTTSLYRGRITLKSPKFAALGSEEEAERIGAVPIYPSSSKVPSRAVERAVALVLARLGLESVVGEGDLSALESMADLPDPIPEEVRRRHGLVPLAEAYARVHRPARPEDAAPGRRRLRWQEAFVLQTALAQRRHAAAARRAQPLEPRADGVLARFDAALPFTLTPGQKSAGERLAEGLASERAMSILLQGEVGSGKTLVALRAMLQAVDAGAQAALLAPTEVLALQHAESIRSLLGSLSDDGTLFHQSDADAVRVVCLTGSMPAAARKEVLLQAAAGTAGIVVGTHALLSEGVSFADLGFVVVDEQHRFGVEQRDALRRDRERPVHMLVMTATPIPRTVAMSVFGDLELLTLEGLPGGRSPIQTFVAPLADHPSWEPRIWSRAREELDAGRQVFVVAPKITPAEADAAEAAGPSASVEETAAWLESSRVLGEHRIEVLHGALPPAEKAEAMDRFARGESGALVSTTVIEVGVDVPNASLMVILDAERFGISQLHQLRGRVGRGTHPGTCLLVTRLEHGHPSRERLDAVAATTDGFALAEADVRLRKEGDILGTAQSGSRRTLKLLSLSRDAETIAEARQDAADLVEADPSLEGCPELARLIDERLGEDRTAFLDRG